MIAVADHAEGCVLPVRAQPGALKVVVTPPPEDGRANKALTQAELQNRIAKMLATDEHG
ncbi:MAG TPA: hypothetical protein VFW33_12110 [Gemmataceae bacterium]|nr:hypothetical protein [Gemmataceae bacterium]